MRVVDRAAAPASRNMDIRGWVPARAEPVIGRRFAPTRWLGRDDGDVRFNFKQQKTYDSAISRRDAPEFCKTVRPAKQRAQGMPGARCTRSLACEIKQS